MSSEVKSDAVLLLRVCLNVHVWTVLRCRLQLYAGDVPVEVSVLILQT